MHLFQRVMISQSRNYLTRPAFFANVNFFTEELICIGMVPDLKQNKTKQKIEVLETREKIYDSHIRSSVITPTFVTCPARISIFVKMD